MKGFTKSSLKSPCNVYACTSEERRSGHQTGQTDACDEKDGGISWYGKEQDTGLGLERGCA
jgi:hypothetical protein